MLVALLLIFLILLHSGRGGGLSDMFGGGSLGGSMAGSTVVERNLDRLTVITASSSCSPPSSSPSGSTDRPTSNKPLKGPDTAPYL